MQIYKKHIQKLTKAYIFVTFYIIENQVFSLVSNKPRQFHPFMDQLFRLFLYYYLPDNNPTTTITIDNNLYEKIYLM